MRSLTVLSVAYPLAPVGPDAVGGSEQVLTALDQALVAGGHRSLVVACEGSRAMGELVAYPAPPTDRPITDADARNGQRWSRERIEAVLATEQVDVIHMHGLDFHQYLPSVGVPMLATLHLPPDWYPPEGLAPPRPDSWVQCVSATQAARMPAVPEVRARMLPPIPNGVPVGRLGALHPKRCAYALMLARVCPEKGLHLALEAAHAADSGLLIGGEIFPYQAHQDYFHEKVVPLLDKRRRYLGPVGFAQKRRLLAAARCLLIPSLVAETSSLVAMEAAACGTPVVAFRSGALPEVVEDGRTGLLVDDVAGMAAGIVQARALDGATCRAVAQARFSHERMAAAHIERYRDLAFGHGVADDPNLDLAERLAGLRGPVADRSRPAA